MDETNSNGQNEDISGKKEAPEKQNETNGSEQKAQESKKSPLEPSVAIAKDGSFFQITIPTNMGHFGASGFINEAVLPWLRSFYKELRQKNQRIISPPQGYRGFNPFKRRK